MKKTLIIFSLLALVMISLASLSNVETQQMPEVNQIEWVSLSFETALASNCTSGSGGTCMPGGDGQICQSYSETCNCTCGGDTRKESFQ